MDIETGKTQLNKKDILKAFGGRVLRQGQETVEKEYLDLYSGLTKQPLANPDIADQYEKTKMDDCLIAYPDFPEGPRKKILFKKLLRGEPNPISLVVLKTMYKNEDGTEGSSFVLSVCKGNLEEQDDRAAIDMEGDRKNLIGEMVMDIDKDGTFKIPHRFVRQDFRGPQNDSKESIGNILLEACEQILKSYANKDGQAKTVEMDAAQLDVILWMDRNKYRPKTAEDQESFDKICSADEDLCVGSDLFIFPNSVPEDKRNDRNSEQAIRIIFNKEISPEQIMKGIQPDQDETRQKAADQREIAKIRERLNVPKT